ncbi:response regulator transcription factor [Taibaiella lutea]|uniref:Response regulator transcription factor n=1 Tax=Taibaiella lutea TaxID=2608001 RepID=A0A5M6CSP9_9BACT|nr:response regulator [Taibaiella lutea]KAA5536179.1 response regulator transcription factor [Taibaiella lutea]
MNNKILVLDDDQDILNIISFILMNKGYRVLTLNNGKEIFKTIKQFHPDLVLMDIMLGTMDGRIICRDIKNTSGLENLPVILISASHDLAHCLHQKGAPNDFIAKPFDIGNLIKKVGQHSGMA